MAQFRLGKTIRQIHAFGFDVDGVKRNSGFSAYRAICEALCELGARPPASYDEFVFEFTSDYDAYYRARGVKGGEDEFMTVYRKHLQHVDMLHPYDDVIELLQHLQKLALPVFVVSGAETDRLNTWFDRHGLSAYIDHVFGNSRNKTACITEACDRLGIMPEMSCFIGDCGLDMRAATDVGAIPIGITRGYDSERALRASGAAHVVENLSELTEALLCTT